MHRTMPAPSFASLSRRVNAVLGPYLVKPLMQTPLVQFMLWLTVGSLPPVARERLCLDWTATDEIRYRAHRELVHAALLAIPDDLQYFPLARVQRQRYRDTGAVPAIPLPEATP
jgi:uncharacterized protein (DUF2236 family)